MNNLNERERGLEELVSAMNCILPRDTMNRVADYMSRSINVKFQNYSLTNKALISAYNILLDNKDLRLVEGKKQFNKIQERWVDNTIKGHEKEIFSGSLSEILTNYHTLLDESEILVQPSEWGFKIEMKDGCVYRDFCICTENRKCIRGTAIKHLVNYHHIEPYVFILTRPSGTHSCTIEVVDDIRIFDVLRSYQDKNQTITLL